MISDDIKRLKDILITFFKIGLFSFGGGYAMIPILERETIENKKWIKREDIIDIIAASESIPGGISINAAAFVGFRIYGSKGAVAATLGVILPSFLIVSAIAAFFTKFSDNLIVKAVFTGIRPAIVALIATAGYKLGKSAIKDKVGYMIAFVSFLLVAAFSVHAIFVIIGGAVAGLLVFGLWPEKVKEILGKGGNHDDIS